MIPLAEVVTSAKGVIKKYRIKSIESELSIELTHFAKFVKTICVWKLQVGQAEKNGHTGVKEVVN